jgi:hypothetical protein
MWPLLFGERPEVRDVIPSATIRTGFESIEAGPLTIAQDASGEWSARYLPFEVLSQFPHMAIASKVYRIACYCRGRKNRLSKIQCAGQHTFVA